MSEPVPSNPIVALAMKLRARKDVESAVDSATPLAAPNPGDDAAASLAAFADALTTGAKRLNSIVGKPGITIVRLEKPLRLRVRFGEKRITLDLDTIRELVIVKGDDLDGEYQFATDAGDRVGLINLSILSTDPGYGEQLTPNSLLKHVARDAELPRPAHLSGDGPLSF